MTDKEKLNCILRLRLFYSTEEEYSELIGYKLEGNRFNKFKLFKCEAYYSKFAEMCGIYTSGKINLTELLLQYRATSKFFKNYIEKTKNEHNRNLIILILNYLYLDVTPDKNSYNKKEIELYNLYIKKDQEEKMNVCILILIINGLIPTFNKKNNQNITDILNDFKKLYSILLGLFDTYKENAIIAFDELPTLKLIYKCINGDLGNCKYLNRIRMIFFTDVVINEIFSLLIPTKFKDEIQQVKPTVLNFPSLWHFDDEPENIFWNLSSTNSNGYYTLTYYNIDYKSREIEVIPYNIFFTGTSVQNIYVATINTPAYIYNLLLKRQQPNDSVFVTPVEIINENRCNKIKEIIFINESPHKKGRSILKAINNDEEFAFYNSFNVLNFNTSVNFYRKIKS